jgi:hypothetical protein
MSFSTLLTTVAAFWLQMARVALGEPATTMPTWGKLSFNASAATLVACGSKQYTWGAACGGRGVWCGPPLSIKRVHSVKPGQKGDAVVDGDQVRLAQWLLTPQRASEG